MQTAIAGPEIQVGKKQRTRRIVNTTTFLIVIMFSAWVFSTPLRNPNRIMPFVADDFYYYLQVARNVARGLDSTFNGITRTNGYHPLYFVFLVFVSKFAVSLIGVFRALWLLGVVATAATFLSARRLLERPSAGPFLTNALALLLLVPCIHGSCLGMEVTLTVPLGMGLLLAFRTQPANWTLKRSIGTGLLAALTVLSRLDAVFLVLLLLFFMLVEPKQRQGIGVRQIAGFAIGGAPLLLAYFMFNRIYFHTWMPVSGTAKQLKWSHWPTHLAITSGGTYNVFLAFFVVYAAIAFWLVWKRLAPQERSVLAAAIAFPYLQVAVLAFVSDWPLWPWYFYTVRFALLAGFVLLLELAGTAWFSRQSMLQKPWIEFAAYCLALVVLLNVHWTKPVQMEIIYDVARQMRAFERTHPGVYAMGGGAGMPGYLMESPLVQTEGLMMDPGFLMHIRHQDNLLTTLNKYGVRYYVAYEVMVPTSFDKQRDGNCFLAEEPYNVGPAALRMRASLCESPLADIVVSDKVVVHIYDLADRSRQTERSTPEILHIQRQ